MNSEAQEDASLPSSSPDEVIADVRRTGEFSDPESASYLTQVLITRRDKIAQGGTHARHPGWAPPLRLTFRARGSEWQLVGVDRQ